MEYATYDTDASSYNAVMQIFTDSLHGLGLTCADIGSLAAYTDSAKLECVDSDIVTFGLAQPVMAGYTPGSNVLDHARIDMDAAYMDMYLDVNDFESAKALYTNGRFSKAGARTIKGFSKKDGVFNEKLAQVPLFETYKNYWGSGTYADDFVMSAFDQTGIYATADNIGRAESIMKGAVYQNVWMYVLREFYDGIEDCEAGDLTDNDAKVHAWDEGVAFYVGQLEYADGSGPGVLGWKLGDKRCANFDTCNNDDLAQVNVDLLVAFKAGKTYLENDQCTEAKALMPEIIKNMAIPLIQGTLRYAYKVGTGGGSKERAEGWAFAAAVLPLVDECDADAAETIKAAMIYGEQTVNYAEVYTAMRSVYECMDITCADVGELQGVTPATALCADDLPDDTEDPEGGAVPSLKIGVATGLLSVAASLIIA